MNGSFGSCDELKDLPTKSNRAECAGINTIISNFTGLLTRTEAKWSPNKLFSEHYPPTSPKTTSLVIVHKSLLIT